MQLVEQHIINRADPRFAPIDAAAFKAKNLYNAALYLVRQSFILAGCYLGYYEDVYHQVKHPTSLTGVGLWGVCLATRRPTRETVRLACPRSGNGPSEGN